MGSSKKQTVGYKYFMGLHFGVCQGPVDLLRRILVGDRVAWQGQQSTSGAISVNAPDLFGGEEREGGVQGTLDVMMGGDTQGPNSYLASAQGGQQPSYRGLLAAVFRRGFVGANNPYIKPWAFTVRRILAGWHGGSAWYPSKAEVYVADDSSDGRYTPTFIGANSASITGLTVPASQPGDLIVLIKAQTTSFSAPFAPASTPGFQQPPDSLLLVESGPALAHYYRIEYAVASGSTPAVISLPSNTLGTVLVYRNATFSRISTDAAGGLVIAAPALDSFDQQEAFFLYLLASVTPGSAGSIAYSGGGVTRHDRPNLANGDLLVIDSQVNMLASEGIVASTSTGQESAMGAFTIELTPAALPPPALLGMNPAHIVYQCLTDPEWGMGYSPTIIDDAGFRAAADVFHAEGLGLCLHWTQQQTIDAFVQTVMDHAGAVLRQDPRTGLFTIKPLRDDYTPAALPLFDESNIRALDSFDRAGSPDAINEITVRYDDAGTGKTGSVTLQNLAAVTAIGGVVAQTRNYPGLPTATLAQRVAMRDLRALSTPLARVRIRTNRDGYAVLPGDVIRMAWPKLGITQLVLRVARVKPGSLTDGEVEIEAVEDVFGLGASTYVAQQPPGWQEPSTRPQPIVTRTVIEAPYYELQRELSAADLAALPADAGYLLACAARPGGAALNYRIVTRQAGVGSYEEAGTGDFCAAGTLAGALGYTDTAATLATVSSPGLIEAGTYALLGPEIVRVDAYDAGTNALTLGRGVLDTVATTHAAGATIFFMGSINASDNVERIDGEAVDVKLLTVAGGGALDETSAAANTLTFAGRAARPYPPGRVRVNGEAYPISAQSPIVLSWAHRNRLQQNLEGDESGNIGPEAGTTYSARLLDAATSLPVASTSAVAGASWAVSPTPPAGAYLVELWSVRAGVESLRRHNFPLSVLSAVFDPFFANVSLLLHLDGANGSTVFTDSGPLNKTVTRSGGAIISTAQSRFGGAALALDGTDDYLSIANNVGLSLNSVDFAVEGFARWAAGTTFQTIIDFRGSGAFNSSWAIGIDTGARTLFVFNGVTNSTVAATPSNSVPAAGVWFHWAVTRSGTSVRLFVQGVLGATVTFNPPATSTTGIRVGINHDLSGDFSGFMDELRITNGAARYTSNFTPPTSAFPDTGENAAGATGALLTAAASLIPGTATNGNATAEGDPGGLPRFLAAASLQRGAAYNDLPSSVLMLLHMDGTNGSTTFTDSSTYGHTITAVRGAAITTADKIAGTGALTLPGDGATNIDGDYLRVGTAGTLPAAFSGMFNGSDWTVEGWAKMPASGMEIFTIGRRAGDLSFVGVRLEFAVFGGGTSTPPSFRIGVTGASFNYNGTTDAPVDEWFHFAIVSTNSGQVRCYVNGVNDAAFYLNQSSTETQDFINLGTITRTDAAMNPFVGSFNATDTAKLDEVRVLNYARYTSDFTPPTPPFPNP